MPTTASNLLECHEMIFILLFLCEWGERWRSRWLRESPIIKITVSVLGRFRNNSEDFQTSIAGAENVNEDFALANVSIGISDHEGRGEIAHQKMRETIDGARNSFL